MLILWWLLLLLFVGLRCTACCIIAFSETNMLFNDEGEKMKQLHPLAAIQKIVKSSWFHLIQFNNSNKLAPMYSIHTASNKLSIAQISTQAFCLRTSKRNERWQQCLLHIFTTLPCDSVIFFFFFFFFYYGVWCVIHTVYAQISVFTRIFHFFFFWCLFSLFFWEVIFNTCSKIDILYSAKDAQFDLVVYFSFFYRFFFNSMINVRKTLAETTIFFSKQSDIRKSETNNWKIKLRTDLWDIFMVHGKLFHKT